MNIRALLIPCIMLILVVLSSASQDNVLHAALAAPAPSSQLVGVSQPDSPISSADPRRRFSLDLAHGLGNDNPSEETISFLMAWQSGENTSAQFNSLATTQPMNGDGCFNYINGRCGVRNYPSYDVGIQATIETITNGLYPNTLNGIRTNQPVVDDNELNTWGTGGDNVRRLWIK